MDLKYEVENDVFDDTTDGVNLLISILVRYPEVSTIDFDPSKKTIKFSFLLEKALRTSNFIELKNLLKDTIDTYNMLKGREVQIVNINKRNIEELSMLEIERDVNTLEQKEIALIIQCLSQLINEIIIKDTSEAFDYEDLKFQDELIETMLESIKCCTGNRPLFGFREEGRVFVFNK